MIEAGTRQVGDAGAAMSDIVAQVKRVADLISDISAATTEQTMGISQVSDAVSQLDQVTQQNAALVEQSAAAADRLSNQSARLVEAVSVFKLGDQHVGHIAPAARELIARRPAKLGRQAHAPAPATVRERIPAPTKPNRVPVAKGPAASETEDWEAF